MTRALGAFLCVSYSQLRGVGIKLGMFTLLVTFSIDRTTLHKDIVDRIKRAAYEDQTFHENIEQRGRSGVNGLARINTEREKESNNQVFPFMSAPVTINSLPWVSLSSELITERFRCINVFKKSYSRKFSSTYIRNFLG